MAFVDLTKIDVYRGESKTLALTFKDSDGVAIDITGKVILLTVKSTLDTDATDSAALISKTGTITDGPNGLASITIASADTEIAVGQYFYDLKYVDGSTEDVMGIGRFNVRLAVTNRSS